MHLLSLFSLAFLIGAYQCMPTDTKRSVCTMNGEQYETGSIVSPDGCRTCRCLSNGEFACNRRGCKPKPVQLPVESPVQLPAQGIDKKDLDENAVTKPKLKPAQLPVVVNQDPVQLPVYTDPVQLPVNAVKKDVDENAVTRPKPKPVQLPIVNNQNPVQLPVYTDPVQLPVNEVKKDVDDNAAENALTKPNPKPVQLPVVSNQNPVQLPVYTDPVQLPVNDVKRDTDEVECVDKDGSVHTTAERKGWKCADGCNRCWCTRGGTVASTYRICPQIVCRDKDGSYHDARDGTWICADGCNTCSCTPYGILSTLMACVEQPVQLPVYTGEPEQLPVFAPKPVNLPVYDTNGNPVQLPVNTRSKRSAECTDTDGSTYDEGASWTCSDGCNRCRCSNGNVLKTRRRCPPKCEHNGETYNLGDKWRPSEHGVSLCSCNYNRRSRKAVVSCTYSRRPRPRPEQPVNLPVYPEEPVNLPVYPEQPVNLPVYPEQPVNLPVYPEEQPEPVNLPVYPPEPVQLPVYTDDNPVQLPVNSRNKRSTCTDTDGKTYSSGAEWTCTDGCNTCRCLNGVIGSTRLGCPKCEYNGGSYKINQSWAEGSSTCTCHYDTNSKEIYVTCLYSRNLYQTLA